MKRIIKRFITGLIIGLLFAMFFLSCSKKHHLEVSKTIVDSVTIEQTVEIRDTVFLVPSDSVQWSISLSDLQAGKELKKNEQRASLTLSLDGDTLRAKCECDTAKIVAQIKDTKTKEAHTRQTESVTVKKVPFVPMWVKVFAILGGVVVLYISLRIGIKLMKA